MLMFEIVWRRVWNAQILWMISIEVVLRGLATDMQKVVAELTQIKMKLGMVQMPAQGDGPGSKIIVPKFVHDPRKRKRRRK
jgi:hypothetical protein